ncbi:MAG: hypothetical protein VX938_13950, partial [Myxococcota bacterium]|nr:hypothetical protein [Myxococcota bacterium]
ADLDDGSYGTYDVDYPDVLIPQGTTQAWGTYTGTEGVSATRFVSEGGHRAYVLGFPLESIVQTDARADLIQAVVEEVGLPTIGSDCGAPPEQSDPSAEPSEDTWTSETSSTSDDLGRPRIVRSPTTVSTEVKREAGCVSAGEPTGQWLLLLLTLLLIWRWQCRNGLNARSRR